MRNRLKEILPHAVILICNMYVAFFLIDRVNPAMNFIDNGLTKGLLAMLCAAAIYNALVLIRLEKRGRRRPAAQRPRPAAGGTVARPASRNAARPANRGPAQSVSRGAATRPANRGAARPTATRRREDRL